MGNRLTMTVDNTALHSYTYDAIYQLTYADYPAGQGADTAYAYDSVFNRTSVNNGSVTNYTANGLNQYTAVGSASLTYDNNGNLTGDGVYTYEYDLENHLRVVKQSGTAVVSYNYNASGRRVSKAVYPTGQYVEYCYDGDQVIAEYDGAGTLLRKYIYGPGIDEPVCMIVVDGQTETRYYYHYDGLGSVMALSNSGGTIVERYRYSAFGQTQILSANYQLRTTSLVGNPYMFTGQEYDSDAAVYNCHARFYKPSLGRFLQPDPIGYADSMNLYQYCGNNPVNFVDPWGLEALTTTGITSSAATWGYMTANGTFIGGAAIGGMAAGSAVVGGSVGYFGIYKPFVSPLLDNASTTYRTYNPAPTAEELAIKRAAIEAKRPKKPRPPSLPTTGEPGKTSVRDDGNGNGQIRDYGPNGKAKTDYDFGHEHGGTDPHAHDWDWNNPDNPRGPQRPIGLDERWPLPGLWLWLDDKN